MPVSSTMSSQIKRRSAEGLAGKQSTQSENAADLSKLAEFLRSKHPGKTAEAVAAASKVPADTVRKWLSGVAGPSLIAGMHLIRAYGPEILMILLGSTPDWLIRAARDGRIEQAEAELARLSRTIENLKRG